MKATSPEKVEEVLRLLDAGMSIDKIAERTELCEATVRKIRNGELLTRNTFMANAGRYGETAPAQQPEPEKADQVQEVSEQTQANEEISGPDTECLLDEPVKQAELDAVKTSLPNANYRETVAKQPIPAENKKPAAQSPWNAHLCDDAPEGRAIRRSRGTPVLDMKFSMCNEALPINFCPFCGEKLV